MYGWFVLLRMGGNEFDELEWVRTGLRGKGTDGGHGTARDSWAGRTFLKITLETRLFTESPKERRSLPQSLFLLLSPHFI